jgi:hypothetical protein
MVASHAASSRAPNICVKKDWQSIVSQIKQFGPAGKKTAVVSTISGDANVPFYKELGNQGFKAIDIPVAAFSIDEEELAGMDTKSLVGHRRPGTILKASIPRKTMRSSTSGIASSRARSAPPTIRWKRTTSASTCGLKASRRQEPSSRMPQ